MSDNELTHYRPPCPPHHHHHHHDPPKPPDPKPWPPIRMEAVTTSVDYGDFLAWTLPHNRHQFDNMVVVTTPKDKRTQDICQHYHVRCVQTEAFYQDGRAFNKAAAINVGLKSLKRDAYVVHLDADILLPPRAKEMIERSQPNPEFIYGIDRMNCPSFEAFTKYMSQPEQQYAGQAFVCFNAFPAGARLVVEQGYVPIGFFQLWHPKASGIYDYSETHQDKGNHSDMEHASLWPRTKRGFIPEIVAVHIQSESDGNETNWRGRRSRPFMLKENS